MRGAIWHRLGRVSYREALAIQERIADERVRELRPDTILVLEHPPTVTLGRRAAVGDVLWTAERLAADGIVAEPAARGGGATYHGPGQLVGYPIVRVSHHGRGVRRFVGDLESVLVEASRRLGVAADRRPEKPGVWVGERKLASIGVEIRRGVSRHGFAWNVDMDLRPFTAIVPCRDPGLSMTDLSREARTKITMAEATEALRRTWERRFGRLAEETSDELEAHG